MAKKFLLYIHSDKFNLEKNKSKLVNELLERHYAPTPYDNMPKVLDLKNDYVEAIIKKIDKSPTIDNNKYCKIHDWVKLTPYGKCLQKGCKYA